MPSTTIDEVLAQSIINHSLRRVYFRRLVTASRISEKVSTRSTAAFVDLLIEDDDALFYKHNDRSSAN